MTRKWWFWAGLIVLGILIFKNPAQMGHLVSTGAARAWDTAWAFLNNL